MPQDTDIDQVIFQEKDKAAPPPAPTDAHETTSGDNNNNMNPLGNAIPMDKLKNGASTATKFFGSAFQKMKEKSSAAVESAKSTNTGSKMAEGLNKATGAVGGAASVAWEKTKIGAATAVTKTNETVTTGWEKTKVGAAQVGTQAKGTLSKGLQQAGTGLEKAKTGAMTGIEAVRTKVGGGGPSGKKPDGK